MPIMEQRASTTALRLRMITIQPELLGKDGFDLARTHHDILGRSLKDCSLPGYSMLKKEEILHDLGDRKFVLTEPQYDSIGRSCCDRKICTHEYFRHGSMERSNVPWWVCFHNECTAHYQMKRRNGTFPTIPLIRIKMLKFVHAYDSDAVAR